jgi:Clostripain family
MSQPKEWTLMFYFASDNPLAPGIVSQLKAIKDAGFHPEVNVIAQFDPHTQGTPTHLFEVNVLNKAKAPNQVSLGFPGEDSTVRSLIEDKLWEDPESINIIRESLTPDQPGQTSNGFGAIHYQPPQPSAKMSGEQDPAEALSSFLGFCRVNYPARHYMLFVLGHGMAVGNDLFLFDEHAGEHSLLLKDLETVLSIFNRDIGQDATPGTLELLSFHSCSMSSLEVAYQLKGLASYMLASQGPAFVGSWPYKQILLRIFQGVMGQSGGSAELSVSSSAKLKESMEVVCSYLSGQLAEAGQSSQRSQPPGLVRSAAPYKAQFVENGRGFAADVWSEAEEQVRLKEMLTNIFYYCLYNSYDFQLAGYSFDLCLSDLNKVTNIKDALNGLSEALIVGLDNQRATDLILLAHWDAQSYYQENYTDLYDFCFRLEQRCARETGPVIGAIVTGCRGIMDLLMKGIQNDDDRIVVRSEFAGPTSQYSRGFSIFFPWSLPLGSRMWDEEYENYKLIQDTSWGQFLSKYFENTRRQTHLDEVQNKPKENRSSPPVFNARLVDMLERVGNRVFNELGELTDLNKAGAHDVTGPGDGPTGHSTKNYPSFTGRRSKDQPNAKAPMSTNFLEQVRLP